jgi:hypothetical protein
MDVHLTSTALLLTAGDIVRMYVGWADISGGGGTLAIRKDSDTGGTKYSTYFAGEEKEV